ncbi:MAG TPA: 50S ribosomal protein L6 [Candidatus Saccharimonadales bacterium]|nr:50S ribosomal protein L6 [Candidatus Saccharimonadales bacterium]
MSKIGKLPITIGSGVTVTVSGNTVSVAGPKGNGTLSLPEGVSIEAREGQVLVKAKTLEDRRVKAMYGLTRANLANLIKGLDSGFQKQLEINGVGYRAQMQGVDLVLSLGFSHPVKIHPKDGVTLAVADNVITVSGTDRQLVGELAANIRKVKPPEPYKGKGIRYKGERVRRKAGKAAKAAGAK